jgi:HEAT repeat protein
MLPKLEPLLKDDSAQVRQAMIQVLWRVGEPAVPHLITALKDKDQNVRMMAANGLRNMGNNAAKAVPTLIELVKEGDQQIRYQAVNTLANIADGADALVKLHGEIKDGLLKANIMQNLGYSQHRQKAIPLIMDGLKDSNAQVKISAMQMLNNVGIQGKEALGALKELVKDSNQQVRVQAVYAMSNMGQPAWPVLEESLKGTKEAAMRQAIVQSMANTGFRSKTAVPELIGLLKDSSPQIRWQACMVLGNNGADAKEALPALRELLNDTNQAVRNHAQNAINRIGNN